MARGHLLLTKSYDDEFIGDVSLQLFQNFLILFQIFISRTFLSYFWLCWAAVTGILRVTFLLWIRFLGFCYVLYGHSLIDVYFAHLWEVLFMYWCLDADSMFSQHGYSYISILYYIELWYLLFCLTHWGLDSIVWWCTRLPLIQ